MAKREVDERVLKRLLDSYQDQNEKVIEDKKKSAAFIESGRRIMNGWGPALVVVGAAAIWAAPALAGIGWWSGEILAGVVTLAGQVSAVAGVAATGKSVVNEVINKKQRENYLMIEDMSQDSVDIEEELILEEVEEEGEDD